MRPVIKYLPVHSFSNSFIECVAWTTSPPIAEEAPRSFGGNHEPILSFTTDHYDSRWHSIIIGYFPIQCAIRSYDSCIMIDLIVDIVLYQYRTHPN